MQRETYPNLEPPPRQGNAPDRPIPPIPMRTAVAGYVAADILPARDAVFDAQSHSVGKANQSHFQVRGTAIGQGLAICLLMPESRPGPETVHDKRLPLAERHPAARPYVGELGTSRHLTTPNFGSVTVSICGTVVLPMVVDAPDGTTLSVTGSLVERLVK